MTASPDRSAIGAGRPVLAQAGIGVVSLANNHCQDFGAEALAETRTHLASGFFH
jgi:hypothetical protein